MRILDNILDTILKLTLTTVMVIGVIWMFKDMGDKTSAKLFATQNANVKNLVQRLVSLQNPQVNQLLGVPAPAKPTPKSKKR